MKTGKSVFLAVAVMLFCAVSVYGQDTREFEERKAALEKEIEMLDRQLAENASRSRSELSRLSLVRAKIAGSKALIQASDRQIRRYSDDIYLTQRKINRMNAKLDTLSEFYAGLIRNAYKNRDAKVWYMYILASDDMGQAFRRYSYFKNMSAQARVQADNIRKTREELEGQKTHLRKLKAEAEALRAERQDELAALQKSEKEAAGIVAQLKKNRSKYLKELAAKKKQVEALDKEVILYTKVAVNGSDAGQARKKLDGARQRFLSELLMLLDGQRYEEPFQYVFCIWDLLQDEGNRLTAFD